jgi:hypothetical protein
MKKLFPWLAVTTEAADKQKIGNSIRRLCDLCFVSKERDSV